MGGPTHRTDPLTGFEVEVVASRQARPNRPDPARDGCPFCAGVEASRTNSVEALAPELVDEWDRERNHGVEPRDVVAASKRKVWWRCPEAADHRWESTVYNRAVLGAGCPFCQNRALARSNSLAVVDPKVARQWHPTKNKPLTPKDVIAGGRRRYWW